MTEQKIPEKPLKTLRCLAGDLSAVFNIDGKHLDRYNARRPEVMQSLCDQLLLHDEVRIPTQDYLTAAGLIEAIGERNLIDLLESQKLRFVRLRGAFGYVRGTGPDGRLVAFNELAGRLASSAPIDRSIAAGLRVIEGKYRETKLLPAMLAAASDELEMAEVVDATHRDAYTDLMQTSHWNESYRLANPDLLALPGLKDMQFRVIGPGTNIQTNAVDCCLALGLINIELHLAQRFDCTSTTTAMPVGDSIDFKLNRMTGGDVQNSERLWSFLDVAGVPDVSTPLLADAAHISKFIKLTDGRDAHAFRQWFHQNAELSEKDLVKAYIDALHDTPWIQSGKGRALRMAASMGLGAIGLGWAIDAAASVLDNFVVDKYARRKGAKFFIGQLRDFHGKLPSALK